MAEEIYYQREIECASREEIKKIQDERLVAQIEDEIGEELGCEFAGNPMREKPHGKGCGSASRKTESE